jgi:hypothetical protein
VDGSPGRSGFCGLLLSEYEEAGRSCASGKRSASDYGKIAGIRPNRAIGSCRSYSGKLFIICKIVY